MRPTTRGAFALGAAAMLAVSSLVAETSGLWPLLLIPALGLAAMAALGSDVALSVSPRRLLELAVRSVLGLGVAVYGWSLLLALDPSSLAGVVGWLAGTVVIGVSAFRMSRRGGAGVPTVVFFFTYALTVLWVLVRSSDPLPLIDVVMFQQQASSALAEGINPYTITFPDLYGGMSQSFYGPGVSVDGILQFGFPYLPLSLLIVAPFEWLFSDFRVAHALALVAAGALMSRLGEGWISRASAAGFLLISPVLNILTLGWTEPLLVLGVIGVLSAHGRSSSSTPYVLGLVVAVKQYAVLLLPSSLLLRERPWSACRIGSDLIKVGVVVAVVTLPFFAWDPEAFYRSVIELQFLQPFRPDSIALPAVWATYFGEPDGVVVLLLPFIGIALVTSATWIRTPTGGQGFALASALTLLVAFMLSKQAFANYYLVVIALLFGAAALADSEATEGMTSGNATLSVTAARGNTDSRSNLDD